LLRKKVVPGGQDLVSGIQEAESSIQKKLFFSALLTPELCILNHSWFIPRGLPRFCHSGESEPTSFVGRNPEERKLDAGSGPA
jgi:hypothetical protein